MEMLEIAAKPYKMLEISDLELRREGKSYTYQTILELKEQFPDAQLVLIMGTDMFLTFESWKNPEIILENASLGVMYRGEKDEAKAIAEKKAHMEAKGAKIALVTANRDSELAKAADAVLCLPDVPESDVYGVMSTASFAATIAIFDALMMGIMEEKDYALSDFALIHPGGAVGKKIN
jgi:arabinose-5-phosphate isomerase